MNFGDIIRFTHVNNFDDDTAYIECLPDGKTIRVSKSGTKFYNFELDYPIDTCLDFVNEGVWREIDEHVALSMIEK